MPTRPDPTRPPTRPCPTQVDGVSAADLKALEFLIGQLVWLATADGTMRTVVPDKVLGLSSYLQDR